MNTLDDVYHACLRFDWRGKDRSQLLNAKRAIAYFSWDNHPSAITASSLDGFVDYLRADGFRGLGCTNATINRYLSSIRVILLRAQRMGLIDQLPLFPEGRTRKESEPKSLVLKREWIDYLESLMQPSDRILIQFLAETGCRISEALDLQWDRIGNGSVQFIRTKGCQARRIPLSEAVQEALRSLLDAGQDRPFPVSYYAFRKRFLTARDRTCRDLGLDDTTKEEWTLHSFRHTRLTELALNGATLPQLMQWAGHRSIATTQRYIHQSACDLESLVKGS